MLICPLRVFAFVLFFCAAAGFRLSLMRWLGRIEMRAFVNERLELHGNFDQISRVVIRAPFVVVANEDVSRR